MIPDIAALALSVVALVVAFWVLSQARRYRVQSEAAAERAERVLSVMRGRVS